MKKPQRKSIWEQGPALLSHFLYPFFVRFSPNLITFISGVVGLLSIAYAGVSNQHHFSFIPAVGLLIFLVLDFIDGDVARHTGKKSAFGAWFDPLIDKTVEAGVFLCILSAVSLQTSLNIQNIYQVFASYCAFSILQFSLVMDRLIRTDSSQGVSPNVGLQENRKFDLLRKVYEHLCRHTVLNHCALILTFSIGVGLNEFLALSHLYFYWTIYSFSLVILPRLVKQSLS